MNTLEQRVAKLRKQVHRVEIDLPLLRAEIASGDTAASHFIDRLRIAIDNATGVALLADARLSAPVLAVARSLLESLITTHWASLSDSNSNEIQTVARFESIRLTRNMLTKGRGALINKIDGRDETQRILNHPWTKMAKRPPKIDRMAKESGLEKLYDLIWGVISLLAHGNDTTSLAQQSGLLPASVEAVRTILASIHLIVHNRVREHRPTVANEIEAILNVTTFR
jgi:hypothetical protein